MEKGRVLKSTGSWYYIKNQKNEPVTCKIRGKLRTAGIKSTNPVAVGDYVWFEYYENEKIGIIKEIEPRNNYIIRKSTKLSKQYHIIASNMDKAFLIITLSQPVTRTLFIDRFLVTTEAYEIPTELIFNKMDLNTAEQDEKTDDLIKTYEKAGYQSMQLSATTGLNLDIMKEKLKGKTSLLAGNSGVGKTTIINALDPYLNLKTASMSKFNTGKHTTTFSEMFELSFGGYVIDTPGIKGFGLIDMDKSEIYHFFPEIFSYAKKCKYHNCMHLNEPGCAVIEAVNQDKISESRYINYLSILEGKEDKYR